MNSPCGLLCCRRWFERLILIAGLFCLASAAVPFARYERLQQTHAKPAQKGDLGRLEIPSIGISVSVLEGDTNENLALGVGHLTDTATLGSHGNAAIAGHRDLAFRSLGRIHPGDEIMIHGVTELAYRVTGTRIVNAADTSTLADDGRARLTLITCYPFHYVGSAPQRFIVEAELAKR